MNRDAFHRAGSGRRGFTLVEMLAVIAVIGVLIAILFVALSGALRSSKTAQATSMLQTIETALGQFETDLGYLPPQLLPGSDWGTTGGDITTPSLEVIASGGALTVPQVQAVDDRVPTDLSGRVGRYMSEFTLAAYLMGLGDFNGDGNAGLSGFGDEAADAERDDGVAGPGFKSPGDAGKAWKSTAELAAGNIVHEPQGTGRNYGPYLDPDSFQRFLALDEDTNLYRIIDPFGAPVRYYSGLPKRDDSGNPTLLRMPPELWSASWAESAVAAANAGNAAPAAGDDRDLLGASYVLLSSGVEPDASLSAANVAVPGFGDVVLTDADAALVLQIADPEDAAAAFNFNQIVTGGFEERFYLEAIRSNVRLAR